MIDPVEATAQWFDPWLSAYGSRVRARRHDVALARFLRSADPSTRGDCLQRLAVGALHAPVELTMLAPRTAGQVTANANQTPTSLMNVRAAQAALVRDPADAAALRLVNDYERDAIASGQLVPVATWSETPKLSACPRRFCQHLDLALSLSYATPVVDRWLEWLLRRVEIKGRACGHGRNQRVVAFTVADACLVLARAWLVTKDARFVNALLRLGDLALTARDAFDATSSAALLAASAVREKALADLECCA